jgi:hypothetical protein
MSQISAQELYELYIDTIARCTSEVRNGSDDEIQYNLFEEFDVGAHSFLHEDALSRLRDAGYIDDEMVALSKQVRERWLALQPQSWTAEEIKSKEEWRQLFQLCDQLKHKSEGRSMKLPERGRRA